ncbi:TPA: hypothetical protein QDZ34_002461 [Stenotrophomonas maltophilia]|uniref:hypothetical protein n=1 Tax=Stenotrophomonas sp. TaxID=69392 RepID=UPI0028B0812B|nr:hypothetical protein [Stenotrophomonas sp.]HDS0949527.1 hypothetical protein [Stenotrophomonas maltophilia]HDS1025998.1 hypothetical protein [Stenotrophomonas maltophilia]HDS1031625.1 hypothetical protein [Stenotrophomonas maltophilia]HDS1035102.1 hypothetical protein [Stenotrophomonas maltophilia]HDS1039105.1 hypothetical protein [Stenotrophomonas maltophilia]
MYRFFSRFINYRRFYVWRARINYCLRDGYLWSSVCGVLFLCLVLTNWVSWRINSVPAPRIHPEAAKVRVQALAEEASHRIAVVHHNAGRPGQAYQDPEEIRAGTVRSLRVREAYMEPAARKLQADLLADIADYIDAAGVCAPYVCWQVSDTVRRLRQARARNANLHHALTQVLYVPAGVQPNLDGERMRVRGPSEDAFQDVIYHGWVLADIQLMHARMMVEYPERAPLPWLSRLLDTPQDPLLER